MDWESYFVIWLDPNSIFLHFSKSILRGFCEIFSSFSRISNFHLRLQPASISTNFYESLYVEKWKKMKKRKRSFKNLKTEKETSQHPWIRTQGDDFVPPNPRSRRLYARNTPDASFLTIHQLPTLYANTSNHRFDLNSFPIPLTSLLEKNSLWTLLKLLQTFSAFKDYGEQTLIM